jgi:hypothetical protein
MGISTPAPLTRSKVKEQPMLFESIASSAIVPLREAADFLEAPTVSFADDPLSFLVEALIAAEPVWAELPGVTPTVLRLALAELEGVGA